MTIRLASLLVALLVGCGLFAGGSAVARQGASPSAAGTPDLDDQPPLPGAVASAERSFRVAGARIVGALFFGFMVVEFDTEAHAATGTPVLIDRLRTTPEFSDLDAASAPSIGDESFAFVGRVDADEITLDLGAVVVRTGRFVYVGFTIGAAAIPLFDLVPIAQRTIRPNAGTAPAATPDAESLLDRLPNLDDLPEGFVLDDERAEVHAASATPVATPEP